MENIKNAAADRERALEDQFNLMKQEQEKEKKAK